MNFGLFSLPSKQVQTEWRRNQPISRQTGNLLQVPADGEEALLQAQVRLDRLESTWREICRLTDEARSSRLREIAQTFDRPKPP